MTSAVKKSYHQKRDNASWRLNGCLGEVHNRKNQTYLILTTHVQVGLYCDARLPPRRSAFTIGTYSFTNMTRLERAWTHKTFSNFGLQVFCLRFFVHFRTGRHQLSSRSLNFYHYFPISLSLFSVSHLPNTNYNCKPLTIWMFNLCQQCNGETQWGDYKLNLVKINHAKIAYLLWAFA